jgi:hypothetical protein
MSSLIWYSPQSSLYIVGTQFEFEVEKANCATPDEMMVLYELDELPTRLAEKIVSELNAARTSLKSA